MPRVAVAPPDWGDMVMNPCDTMTNQPTSSTVSEGLYISVFPILSAVPHKRATWYEKLTTGPESAVGDVHVHVQVSRF